MRRTGRGMRRGAGNLPIAAILLIAAAVVCAVVVGFRSSALNREAEALERSVVRLRSSRDNLQMCIDTYYDMERIESRARQLGMEDPQEGQVRVVRVPGLSTQTSVLNQTGDTSD